MRTNKEGLETKKKKNKHKIVNIVKIGPVRVGFIMFHSDTKHVKNWINFG